MSLFKTKEWWRTMCGAGETFDGRSMLVTALFGEEKKDIVAVGSHDGYLRIYSPSSEWVGETKSPTNYKSKDLMIETRIADCIVDMKAGRFVSGSQGPRLAILTSSKLIVYDTSLADGSAEYGDRCELKVAYEHALPRFPSSLTTGPFGGVRGRDFLCVQCLDGTLLFYEQEAFAFSRVLRNRLLPEPIVYVSRNDLFVTASSSWFIECYRYQSMAESAKSRNRSAMARDREDGDEDDEDDEDEDEDEDDDEEEEHGVDARRPAEAGREILDPDWSYNIGEAILDLQAVTLSSFEVGLVVLGEKQLYCLKDNCASVKYAKRLDFRPLCFRAYVIEPDGKLMVLVIADTSTLMIYEGTALKWSAQLPFAPVTVQRARLQHLDGVIVVLSDDGRLEACYLGSEPGLFVAPPLHPRGYDYAAAEQRLAELRNLLGRRKSSDGRTGETTAVDAELMVTVNVSPDLEASDEVRKRSSTDSEGEADGRRLGCRATIELSSYATLRDVQLCVDVCRPLVATETFHVIPHLRERHVAETVIRVEGDLPAISSEIGATVTYRTEDGNLRALRRTAQLPLKMMLRTCPPENSSVFTTVVKRTDPLLAFTHLFPEFAGDQVRRQSGNALGLRYPHTGHAVTIVSGNASNRYRVQSNDGLSTTLVVQQLVNRLKERATGSLGTTVGQNHIQLVQSRLEGHSAARRKVDEITTELELLTAQLRNIERKLLRTIRERNGRSLADTGLPFLLDSSCRAIFRLLEDLAKARADRDRAGHELWCGTRLLLQLVRLNASREKYAAVEAAIGFEPRPCERFDWEEIADAALTSLLGSASRKPGTDAKPPSRTTIAVVASDKELAKLKKRLVHAIERIDGSRESDIAEVEPNEAGELASA